MSARQLTAAIIHCQISYWISHWISYYMAGSTAKARRDQAMQRHTVRCVVTRIELNVRFFLA